MSRMWLICDNISQEESSKIKATWQDMQNCTDCQYKHKDILNYESHHLTHSMIMKYKCESDSTLNIDTPWQIKSVTLRNLTHLSTIHNFKGLKRYIY